MAEEPAGSAAPPTASVPQAAPGAANVAASTSDKGPKRPPGIEAADNPEWCMRFLAQVYIAARKDKQAVGDLPNWFYSRPEVGPSGEVSYPHNKLRDKFLGQVVSDLVATKELAADAASTDHDRWLLYRHCFTVGTVVIESRSAYQLVNTTLPATVRGTLNLLETASPLWIDLHHAALLVRDRFAKVKATRRDADLEAVLFPQNLRGRDGAIPRRIDRLRHIQAIRSFRIEVPTELRRSEDPKPSSSTRGLNEVPLARGTDPFPRVEPPDKLRSLRPAFDLLQRIAWHPDIDEFMTALQTSSGMGKQKLTAMVVDSISDAGSLTKRITDDSRRVWRFPAALRIGVASIEGLTAAEKEALTLFLIAVAKDLKTALEEALEAVGVIVTMLALFGGPLAPVAAVADAIIQSAAAAVSFMRQVDQDRAESSSIFQKQAERLSTGGRYLEPAAQAVGALLAAAAAPGAVSQVAREVKAIQRGAAAADRVPAALGAAGSATLKAEERGVSNTIKAAAADEQGIQRALQKGPSEEVPVQPTGPAARRELDTHATTAQRKSVGGTSTAPSLEEQIASLQKQVDELANAPDAPALQRDLEYVEYWTREGRRYEAQKLLDGLRSRVEKTQLSRERGVFESVYETGAPSPDGHAEPTPLRVQDRPPGVTKSESVLWARVRAGEEPNITGFTNPSGDRLKIDPNFRPHGENGLTNRELTQRGRAPYLNNGERVELHHRDQDPFGPLDESSETFHRLVGEDPDFHPETSDPGYESWRRYLVIFEGKRRALGDVYKLLRERYWMGRFN
jgi:hypothetical protein